MAYDNQEEIVALVQHMAAIPERLVRAMTDKPRDKFL